MKAIEEIGLKTVDIYNIRQVDMFLKHGCRAVGSGVSSNKRFKTVVKTYVKFVRDDKFNELLDKWNNREL